MLSLTISFGDCALVTTHLTALLDHLNSKFHVASIVLKTVDIRLGIYSSFNFTLVPATIKLKYVYVIRKSFIFLLLMVNERQMLIVSR